MKLERRLVTGVVLACVGAVFEEYGNTAPIGAAGSRMERVVAAKVIDIWVCAMAQKEIDTFKVASACCQ